MLDLLIKNGRIIDGSGNPWYYADLGIKDDEIAVVGNLQREKARKVLDVKSLVICPGFIDVHSHSDAMLLVHPDHDPKIRQGITTDMLGMDGLSYAPVTGDNLDLWLHYLSGLNGVPRIPRRWSSVGEFLDVLDRNISVNVVYFVPHGPVRTEVLGMEARLPTPEELQRMKGLVARGMEEGAAGVATGLTYPPCCYADTHEVIELCRAAAPYGGVYVTHLRSYGEELFQAIEETFTIGREADIPVHFSHYAATGVNRGKSDKMLEAIDRARLEGLDVTLDSYPYIAGSTMLNAILPAWIHVGGPQAILEKIKDPDNRQRIKQEIQGTRFGNLNVSRIAAVYSEKNKHLEGLIIAEAAEKLGKDPIDFICDLLLEENLAVSIVVFLGNEDDVCNIMQHPCQMFSTDGLLIGGKLHPRAFGTYPRVLGRYVREKKILKLEDAIRRMTSFPARRFQMKKRGLIEEGYKADLVIFDPETVIDTATYENPRSYPEGIPWVIVNGEVTIENGNHTGAKAGRTFRISNP